MLQMALPKLKNWLCAKETKEFCEETYQFLSSFVKNRRRSYKEGQKHDLTDAFLEKIHETTARGETGSSFYGELGCKGFSKIFLVNKIILQPNP